MSLPETSGTFDYVIVGSGFGGSVSAMRLVEKGYRVLVVERGKRFNDNDFARSNWNIWRYLWAPALRAFGILEISFFRNVWVLHGSGVGGGSLGYANVLMEPPDRFYQAPEWQEPHDWQSVLRPHFDTARRMLGVARNPRLWPADQTLREIAAAMGREATFRPTEGAFYYGDPDHEVEDPYFGGEGPTRRGCNHCGGCMVGCRHNAKNTLVKNYLYLAEKWGACVRAETEVEVIRPLHNQPDGARYELQYRSSTRVFAPGRRRVRARNVIVAAGALGSMRLLFRCRDVARSLPRLSAHLGDRVRTNNEALMGAVNRGLHTDYSEGIAITSIFSADDHTTVEPVRYPKGSSAMRFLSGPMIRPGTSVPLRIIASIAHVLAHPLDFARSHFLPGWAKRTTILLFMQTKDNMLRMRLGRSLWTALRRNLVSVPHPESAPPEPLEIAHQITCEFGRRTNAIALGSINEGLFSIPMTAHILGGVPMGRDESAGVVGADCQVHNYPGLYVIDGSIMPGNPGVNPSLTITALAEYAMSLVPDNPHGKPRPKRMGVETGP